MLVKASPLLIRRVPKATRAIVDPDLHDQVGNVVKDVGSAQWEQQLRRGLARFEADIVSVVEPGSAQWERRAKVLGDRLADVPQERLARRQHLNEIADGLAQLKWELARAKKAQK
ncbi:MAG TPA: hypothetical protein PKK40_03495 [Marmoricola sp.]|nr:hypothetical protein [Marmoricola sp.]